MSLKFKLRLLICIAAAGLVALTAVWTMTEHSLLLAGKEDQTRSLVELAYSTAAAQYKLEQAGQLTQQQAQSNAIATIRSLRYGDNNYFWINNMDARLVMHALKPDLEGRDLSYVHDAQGRPLYAQFIRMASEHGSGTDYYEWPRPGASKPVPKLAYVREFQPWGWVIGTGIYIDDVDSAWMQSAREAAAISLLCLAILLIVSTKLSRSILGRLRHLGERIQDVAQGEADLTRRIEIDAHDEIAEVAEWFNRFMDSLHGIIASVADSTDRVDAAATEISGSATSTARGSREQSGQINQVATAMHEMEATVAEISRNATQASDTARHAVDVAHQGGVVVSGTLSRMSSISDSVGAAAHRIGELGKRSSQIGSILAVIEDIAGQTNLLALNAAIEAARAGEHGRGFAVVAGEVRRLAERTTAATREIATTIEAVQQDTAMAVDQIKTGTDLVEQGVAETSRAGAALEEIMTASREVGDMISQIAAASTQQSATVSEINRSVTHIATLAQQSEVAVEQSTATCGALSGLASGLTQLVGRFHLNRPPRDAHPHRAPHKQKALSDPAQPQLSPHPALSESSI